MKILYVANIHRHFNAFHKPYIKMLRGMGHEVHVAANGEDKIEEADVQYHIDIQRSPYRLKNIRAYSQLKKIIETEKYDVVHCHTPMGGILGRLASSKRRKQGMKVIYTAHGFHFCKGGPIKNWVLYYPIERFMSKYTDVIITINKEDFQVAKKFNVKQHFSIPGIGIEINKFKRIRSDFVRHEKRHEIGVNEDEVLLISTGDLSVRKNHQIVIKAISKLHNINLKYAICGNGDELEHLKKLAEKMGVSDKIIFLGFRTDVKELLRASDIFIFPSLWEGLGIAGIEAMAAGIPVIASNRHGIKDYAINNKTALLCDPNNSQEFAEAIQKMVKNRDLSRSLVDNAYNIINDFDLSKSLDAMNGIYEKVLC